MTSTKILIITPYLIVLILSIVGVAEIFHFGIPHYLLHFRYGDDLVFFDSILEYDRYITKNGWGSLLGNISSDYAYGSIYWFCQLVFLNFVKIFGSIDLIGLSPTLLSQFFLILGLINIIKIYKIYFKEPLLVLAIFLIFLSMPMVLSSGIRIHNYSMTLFLSSGLFLFLKKLKKFEIKEAIQASLWISLLLAVKLSGAIIAPALMGILWSKKEILRKSKWAVTTTVILTPFLFIFFLKPSLIENLFQLDFELFGIKVKEFVNSMQAALSGNDQSFTYNVSTIIQHILPMVVFVILLLSGILWTTKDTNRSEPVFFVLSLISSLLFIALTAKRWHGPTYLIGHTFIYLLLLKGCLYKKKYKIHLFVSFICLFFSLKNLSRNLTIQHLIPDKKTKEYYQTALEASQDFISKNFHKEDESMVFCDLYSICPWATPESRVRIRLAYSRSNDNFRNADFLFLNKNIRSIDGHFTEEEDAAWVDRFIANPNLEENRYEKIYELNDFIVFRKMEAFNEL